MPDDVTLIVSGQAIAGRLKRPPTLAIFECATERPAAMGQDGEFANAES